MDQWLVRTAENVLAGPYTREQIRQLIISGQLSVQDEICQANAFWIFLHESEEVSKSLGQDILLYLGEKGVDQTQTQTEPNLRNTPLLSKKEAETGEENFLPGEETMPSGHTTVMTSDTYRSQLLLRRRTQGGPILHISPTIQQSFWSRFAWVWISIIALGIAGALYMTRP